MSGVSSSNSNNSSGSSRWTPEDKIRIVRRIPNYKHIYS